MPVFLGDGEELTGAKQNPMLNLSILVPAVQAVVTPVSGSVQKFDAIENARG
jgi:hypothetical protein